MVAATPCTFTRFVKASACCISICRSIVYSSSGNVRKSQSARINSKPIARTQGAARDLNFCEDVRAVEASVRSLAETEWSIFYGSYIKEVSPDLGISTTAFMGFSGNTIAELVDYLTIMSNRSGGGPMHVDGAYNWYRRAFPYRKTFIATPQIGYQRSSRSDITAGSFLDQIPRARKVVGIMRKVKNSLVYPL